LLAAAVTKADSVRITREVSSGSFVVLYEYAPVLQL